MAGSRTGHSGSGSLVDEVGRQVRAASAGLPVPELRAASQWLGQASQRLGQVLHGGAVPAVPTLRAAGEHLDLATGLLLRAQDALAEYLQMIGLPPGERPAVGRPETARRSEPAGTRTPVGRPQAGPPTAAPRPVRPSRPEEPEELDEPTELAEPGEEPETVGAGAFWGDAFDDSVDTDYWAGTDYWADASGPAGDTPDQTVDGAAP